MEGQHLALQVGIRIRDALVLAQMFRPGFDHEPFGDLLRIGGVLGHAPAIGAVAATFLGQMIEGMQEWRGSASRRGSRSGSEPDHGRLQRAPQRAAPASDWTAPDRPRRKEA